jgi:hypothetical protein
MGILAVRAVLKTVLAMAATVALDVVEVAVGQTPMAARSGRLKAATAEADTWRCIK